MNSDKDMKSTKHGNICKAISGPLKRNLAGDWKRTPGVDEASSNDNSNKTLDLHYVKFY